MDTRRYAIEALERIAEDDMAVRALRHEFDEALRRVKDKRVVIDLESAFNAAWIEAAYAVAKEAVSPTFV
jgi:hypothetical protein